MKTLAERPWQFHHHRLATLHARMLDIAANFPRLDLSPDMAQLLAILFFRPLYTHTIHTPNTRTRAHTHTQTHINTHAHTHAHTHTHARTHARTPTHSHSLTLFKPFFVVISV